MASESMDPGMVRKRSRIHYLMRLVRIEHTIFSLPFAYSGAIMSGYDFTLRDAILIFTAVLGLRTAAMAYNNIADLDIDKANPRTRMRPLVVGAVSLREAWLLVAAGSILYMASAALLNKYALLLSPILLALALAYPHAKRHHSYPHIHLGMVLGSVVMGGAIAASGDEAQSLLEALSSVPWLYVAGVTLWVAGFDVIYSVMDYEFDRRMGLGSIPARFGVRRALFISLVMHVLAVALFLYGGIAYGLSPVGLAMIAAGSLLILYEHVLAWRGKLATAFNINLVVALLIGLGAVVDWAVASL